MSSLKYTLWFAVRRKKKRKNNKNANIHPTTAHIIEQVNRLGNKPKHIQNASSHTIARKQKSSVLNPNRRICCVPLFHNLSVMQSEPYVKQSDRPQNRFDSIHARAILFLFLHFFSISLPSSVYALFCLLNACA